MNAMHGWSRVGLSWHPFSFSCSFCPLSEVLQCRRLVCIIGIKAASAETLCLLWYWNSPWVPLQCLCKAINIHEVLHTMYCYTLVVFLQVHKCRNPMVPFPVVIMPLDIVWVMSVSRYRSSPSIVKEHNPSRRVQMIAVVETLLSSRSWVMYSFLLIKQSS